MKLTPDQAELKAAYDEQISMIDTITAKLLRQLVAHRSRTEKEGWRNYGRVGDVTYVCSKIGELAEFME